MLQPNRSWSIGIYNGDSKLSVVVADVIFIRKLLGQQTENEQNNTKGNHFKTHENKLVTVVLVTDLGDK